MSKQKPLPAQKGPPLPLGGSSTGRPLQERAPKPIQSESPVARPWTTPVAPSPLVKFEHRAVFCQADEGAFGALAATMERDGWELVSTESCHRHVSTANGTGMSQGWMTFWKRLKQEKAS